MAKRISVRGEIQNALENFRVVLNQDIEKIVTVKALDMSEAIVNGQDKIYQKLEEHDKRFDQMDQRMQALENGQVHLKDGINGLKGELSTTVSKKEFNELKVKINEIRN